MISLLKVLHDKALSKRGYDWTGKLLSSLLLTLTHTYPLENKFVNPEEWQSEGKFQASGQVRVANMRFQISSGIIIDTGAKYMPPTKSR